MPLYEYQCGQCGRFEIIRKFSDAPLQTCPTCGQEVQKLLSSPAIQFKGTGWYITDYARKSSGKGESKSDSSSEGSKSEAKDSGAAKESSSKGSAEGGSSAGSGTTKTKTGTD